MTFRLTVTDDNGAKSIDDMTVTVPRPNTGPRRNPSVTVPNYHFVWHEGGDVELPAGLFTDDEGPGNITYHTSRSLHFPPNMSMSPASYTVRVTATDRHGAPSDTAVEFTVAISARRRGEHIPLLPDPEPASTSRANPELMAAATAKADAPELGWDDVTDAAWRVLSNRQGSSQHAAAALWQGLEGLGGDDN